MNLLEKQMVDKLIDLKENHNIIGVKAEFEAEGMRFDEALRLKDITAKSGLDLTIKIGGCEALKDLYEVKDIGVSAIVAPMVETPYAMKKFVKALNLVFPKDEHQDIKFYINIETITGFNNLNDMILSPEFNELSGIVLGRSDMTASMGFSKLEVNSEQILNIAQVISNKIMPTNKELIIGGNVSLDSIPFFNAIQYLSKFETRKIIFDSKVLHQPNVNVALNKALEFEIMWLKNKRDAYGIILKQDEDRLEMLRKSISLYS